MHQKTKNFWQRTTALILVFLLIWGMVPNVSFASSKVFTPRLTAPDVNNLYYKHHSMGGKNYCIKIAGGPSVLPNCVGYAWGRAYEITGEFPKLSRGHAKTFYGHAKTHGYQTGLIPKVGSIVCWSGGRYGHVQVVEKVEGNTITVSESNYRSMRYNPNNKVHFRTKTFVAPTYVGDRGPYRTLRFQGYIYLGDFGSPNNQAPSTVATAYLTPVNASVGSPLNVKFDKSSLATSYDVKLICEDDSSYNQIKQNVTALSVSFIPKKAGRYKATVIAKNQTGQSSPRTTGTVTVHPDNVVKFVDWDDKLINEQVVKYGGNAKAPTAPTREGYRFNNWSGAYNNVTSNLTLKAEYSINKYKVKFVGIDGDMLEEQTVKYGQAASVPQAPTVENYSFIGWDSDDYKSVTKNMTVKASYRWTNPDLPNVVQITSATRTQDASGYNVTVNLANSPIKNVQGRVIVA